MMVEIEGNRLLFTIAYVLCLIDAILLGYSSIGALTGATIVSRCLCIGALFLILMKILSDGFYSLMYVLLMFFIGLLLLIVYLKSGYNHILYFLIVFLGMRNVQSKYILRIDYWMKILFSMFIIACALIGIIENYITFRTGERILRYSLGFNHPNTLASVVFSLIIEEAYLNNRKANAFYTALIWLIDGFLYLITSNRTAVLLIALFPILLGIMNESDIQQENNFRNSKIFICTLGYPLAVITSLIIMLGTRKNSVLTILDHWFSNRFYNANVIYRRYGIPVLGQKVTLISVKIARLLHSSIALLDVAYLRLLIQAGPIVLLIIGILYCFAINKIARNRNRFVLGIILLFLIYGLCESGTNNVFINFSILFIVEEFYKSEKLSSEGSENLWIRRENEYPL